METEYKLSESTLIEGPEKMYLEIQTISEQVKVIENKYKQVLFELRHGIDVRVSPSNKLELLRVVTVMSANRVQFVQ